MDIHPADDWSVDQPSARGKVWAIISLIFAVPGLAVPGAGIVAILCAGLSFVRGRVARGAAITGLILGGLGTFTSFAVVLPTYRSIRDLQNAIFCQSNLSQIGKSINQYSNENRGYFPPDFATLMAAEQLDPKLFICPSTDDTPAPGSTPAERASHLNDGGHLSYVYLGKDMSYKTNGDAIIAYEKGEHPSKAKRNLLHVDGSVQPASATQFYAALAAQGISLTPLH